MTQPRYRRSHSKIDDNNDRDCRDRSRTGRDAYRKIGRYNFGRLRDRSPEESFQRTKRISKYLSKEEKRKQQKRKKEIMKAFSELDKIYQNLRKDHNKLQKQIVSYV